MVQTISISFDSIISVDRRKKEPIYLQITYQFTQAIQRGYLPIGAKIPGTRKISKDLNVHRKTVIAAFDELHAQGWIAIRPNVGTFICEPLSKKEKQKGGKSGDKEWERATFPFRKSFILDSPYEESSTALSINDGQPDYRIINTKEISRFYGNAIKRRKVFRQIEGFSKYGNDFFTQQLSFYLNAQRRFHISENNLAIASRKEIILYTLSQIIIERGDNVLIGGFGFFIANMIFRQAGANIGSIPVDKEGISAEYIKKNYKKGSIKCLYINPENHYPTTVRLSSKRRKELLRLAQEYNFIILEDDNDFELNYSAKEMMPLASSNSNQVIYLGNFGRFLLPSFQRSFIIAPHDLIKEIEKYLHVFDAQSDAIVEQALGEMIKDGDIHRYLRKAVVHHKKRSSYFNDLLQELFNKEIRYTPPQGGLAYWLIFPESVSLTKLAYNCKMNDLFIPRICMYQNRETTALRIGFGNFTKMEAKRTLEIIKDSVFRSNK